MRKILIILLTAFFGLFFSGKVFAQDKPTFITISNPVRGPEGWQNPTQGPLELPKFQYIESTRSALPITWLMRYDAVTDATISAYFSALIEKDPTQTLGAFMEITPRLTQAANVNYPDGFSIFNANRIFLSGYSPEERIRLIDAFMESFLNRFGFYPRSVSAWDLDSYSLKYLREKYSVIIGMNCDDQYSMDHYRIWGGYLGSPYLPSKSNSLVPAKNLQEQVGVVMVRWAQRDLFNFYGSHAESLYSVQVNDYQKLNLDSVYFQKLVDQYSQKDFNEFTHINIGLENDDSLKSYGIEIKGMYTALGQSKSKLNLQFISLEQLGNWVLNRYPESSPAYFYKTKDPLEKKNGTTYWYQNSKYRIGIRSEDGKTKIIDLRVYNTSIFEDYFSVKNINTNLYNEIPAAIDSIKYPGTALDIDIDLEKSVISYANWRVKFSLGLKTLELKPDEIVFTGLSPIFEYKDISVGKTPHVTTWKMTPFTPFSPQVPFGLFITAVVLLLIYFLVKNRLMFVGMLFALVATGTVIKSAQLYPFGLGIWGPNGHDAIFHLSLINKFSSEPVGLSHPQFAGQQLTNYHFLFDYLSGLISKVTHLTPVTVYFSVFPFVVSILLLIFTIKLLKSWRYKGSDIVWSLLFAFLGGSLGFIPKLIMEGNLLAGESTFWANQSVSIFLNPPFALSLLILVIFLYKNSFVSAKSSLKSLILLGILGGILAQTKIYAFILLCMALFITGQFKLVALVGVIGSLITLPFSSFTGSPFIVEPFWFAKSLFASSDRLPWPRYVQAWQTYEASGSFLKLLFVNGFAITIFLLGNLGTRVLGLFAGIKNSSASLSEKTAFWISILGILIPLVIIQRVNPWNTIQFMYYSLFFLGLFSGKIIGIIGDKCKNILLKISLYALIIVFTLPTTIGTLRDYTGFYSSSRISYTELGALDFLRTQPRGVVLSPVFPSPGYDKLPTPKTLYSYVSTAYISAFTGKPEYLSDTINLDITGFDYKERSKNIKRLFTTKDKVWAKDFLFSNNIAYVYETPLEHFKYGYEDMCLEKIFDSGEINIYKFNCHGQK